MEAHVNRLGFFAARNRASTLPMVLGRPAPGMSWKSETLMAQKKKTQVRTTKTAAQGTVGKSAAKTTKSAKAKSSPKTASPVKASAKKAPAAKKDVVTKAKSPAAKKPAAAKAPSRKPAAKPATATNTATKVKDAALTKQVKMSAVAKSPSSSKSVSTASAAPAPAKAAAKKPAKSVAKTPAKASAVVASGAKGKAAPQRAVAAASAPPSDKISAPAKAPEKKGQRHGFKLNEHVVYPAHGVGRIVGIEEQEIAGHSLELFVITFDKEKLTLRVPTGKLESVGMRKLAEADTVKKAMDTLKGRARIKRTMWSRRAQEYVAKINSGSLVSIAEVVRDLYRSDAQPEQSYSERQLYEDALDRMAREIAAVEKLDERGAVQRITDVLSKSARGRRAAAEAEAEAAAEAEAGSDPDAEKEAEAA